MAKSETPKRPTRKQLVGRAKEAYYNRIILIATAALVGIVLLLVSWTWIRSSLVYPNQTVVVVEGKEIKGRDFVAETRFNRQQLLSTYNNYVAYLQFFTDEASQQSIISSLSQIQSQLDDPTVMGQYTADQIVDDELLKIAAADMGISVSEEEIDKWLQDWFSYYPDGTPTPVEVPTDAATSTLSATQLAIVSPTPTITPTELATSEEAATATVTVTATSEPTEGPSPTPQPTATTYTFDAFETDLSNYYTSNQEDIGFTEEQFRDMVRLILLRDKVKEEITKDLSRTQEMVWARHILVANEEDAQLIYDGLAGGIDWSALASELSIDTGTKDIGGDLGWFTHDAMVAPFSDAAFDLEVGEVSDPIESQFGWHVIQVLGHEDRPVTESQYQQLQDDQLNEFIQGLRDKYTWEIKPGWEGMAPTTPTIPADQRVQ